MHTVISSMHDGPSLIPVTKRISWKTIALPTASTPTTQYTRKRINEWRNQSYLLLWLCEPLASLVGYATDVRGWWFIRSIDQSLHFSGQRILTDGSPKTRRHSHVSCMPLSIPVTKRISWKIIALLTVAYSVHPDHRAVGYNRKRLNEWRNQSYLLWLCELL
jgi:hypothetical protein